MGPRPPPPPAPRPRPPFLLGPVGVLLKIPRGGGGQGGRGAGPGVCTGIRGGGGPFSAKRLLILSMADAMYPVPTLSREILLTFAGHAPTKDRSVDGLFPLILGVSLFFFFACLFFKTSLFLGGGQTCNN